MSSSSARLNPPGIKLILYIDFRSQPARALISFCRLNGIQAELKEIHMFKGEHMKPPFSVEVNPAKQLPALQEIDEATGQVRLTLSESHAILRYLATTRGCPDHWYPADLRRRAVVNHYLDEHHNFLRQGVGQYAFKKLFAPLVTGQTYTEEALDLHRDLLARGLMLMENRLAKTRYLCGDEVSIADLSACCELDSSRFLELNLDSHPKVKAWLHHMIDENPIVLEIHQPSRGYAAEWVEAARKKRAKL